MYEDYNYSLVKPDPCFSFESLYGFARASDNEPAMVPWKHDGGPVADPGGGGGGGGGKGGANAPPFSRACLRVYLVKLAQT